MIHFTTLLGGSIFVRRVLMHGRYAYRVGLLSLLSVIATQAATPPANVPVTTTPTVASEHQVKAAILYRVAKFIDWPTSSFASSDSPFVVCVVGDADALRAFESLTGRALNGHNITVRRVTGDMLDLRLCHAAFFSADAGAEIDYALGKLQSFPVLTVGETEDFARRGGVLALLTREQRVKFALNLPVSKQAGLIVSSQLLQLAIVVGHTP